MVQQSSEVLERSIIGAILIDSSCLPDLIPVCSEEYFTDGLYKTAYSIAAKRHEDGERVDASILSAELSKRGYADNEPLLQSLMEQTPTAANVLAYAKLLKEGWQQAQLLEAAAEFENDLVTSEDSGATAAGMISKLENKLQTSNSCQEDLMEDAVNFGNFFFTVQDNPMMSVVPTNIKSLDILMGGGLQKGGMYLIAARPGVGKTSFAVNLAESLADHGEVVRFISMEMSKTQIYAKRVAKLTNFSYGYIMTGQISEQNNSQILDALEIIQKNPVYVSDASGLSVSQIEAIIRRTPGVKVAIVDYLGLIRPEKEDQKKTRYEQVTGISWALKLMAKRLDIPVIVLAQLNRESMKDKPREPRLTDLRDSGALEQDSDGVMLLQRNAEETTNLVAKQLLTVYLAKNRHGPTGQVQFAWNGQSGRISEMMG